MTSACQLSGHPGAPLLRAVRHDSCLDWRQGWGKAPFFAESFGQFHGVDTYLGDLHRSCRILMLEGLGIETHRPIFQKDIREAAGEPQCQQPKKHQQAMFKSCSVLTVNSGILWDPLGSFVGIEPKIYREQSVAGRP